MVSQFLRNATGNDHWQCPLCSRTDVSDGSHWTGKPHVKAVWYAVDEVNVLLGMPRSTYTNAAYGCRTLWAFKACQPSSRGSFTAAVSLLDGQCFLLEDMDEGGFMADERWVSFLGTAAIPPSQISAASLPLAIDFGSNKAG